jgi:hypothetical protein
LLHSKFFGRNSSKNGPTQAVEFPPPILVEYHPSWPKFGTWLFFSATVWVKFSRFVKISTNLNDIRPKSVAEIQLRAFDRF